MQAAIVLIASSAWHVAVSAKEAGFPSNQRIEIEQLSGTKHTIELGKQVPGMPRSALRPNG